MDPPERSGADVADTDGLGLDKSEVRLSPHRTNWAARGEAECAAVRALLGALASHVVHVGSTAVPGLEAKPILDVVGCVGDAVPADHVVHALGSGGEYAYEGDMGEDGGLLFVRGHGSVRTVHLHVVSESSAAWVDYRRFHALLVRDADARSRYQSAKRELAARFAHDRPGYTAAKGVVVRELLEWDRAARPGAESGPHGP